MRRLLTGGVTVLAVLLAAGCSTRSDDDTGSTPRNSPTAQESQATSSDFGTLRDVCGPGVAGKSSVQGVRDDKIQVGVFSDVGFTKKSEFVDAAKVFTSWCNDAGGINGRELEAVSRDTRFMEVRQRTLDACREDFALVGGGAAMDSLGVKDRLKCLLPNFPAQASQIGAIGSDLQVIGS
ncbi:MAG TPA: ABC transporter substrate-binding protein, partial [Streptomyces sp.]|nr:ABC transporter substrate-binding protein [Streptomyces sp.]